LTQSRVTQHRAISTAEKRSQLKAAGEEWPVGSDGLPKVWHADRRKLAGGSWKLRSTMRATHQRYNRSENRKAANARYEESSIQVQVAQNRTTYRIAPGKKQEIRERLDAFRKDQTRTRQEARENGWID
jgi:hypothetical protein